MKNLRKWVFISQRILTFDMQLDKGATTTLIVVCGPNEDEMQIKKRVFFGGIVQGTETINGRIIILVIGWREKQMTALML